MTSISSAQSTLLWHRHRPRGADVGAAGIPDRHPDPREQHRRHDARELADYFTAVAALPANGQHAEVAAYMKPRVALSKDVRALQVGKRVLEIAARTRRGRE